MHYDAIGTGENDIKLGDSFFESTAKNKLSVLDAYPNAPKSTVPYIIKNVSGVRIGIISVGGLPDGSQADIPSLKAIYTSYKAARSGSDILILLDQGKVATKEWLERNGPRLGMPDVIIGGVSRAGEFQEEIIGNAHVMPTSLQGKYLGIADIEFTPGQAPKLTASKVDVVGSTVEDESIAKLIKDYNNKNSISNGSQASPNPVVNNVSFPKANSTVPMSAVSKPYYPPQLCKTCHIKEYEDWAKTKHAAAITSLSKDNKMLPECLSCHSEMFRRLGQVIVPSDNVGGVECATCHADSLPHGMEHADAKIKTKVDAAICLSCHTKERSPGYSEKSYMPRVAHKIDSHKSN